MVRRTAASARRAVGAFIARVFPTAAAPRPARRRARRRRVRGSASRPGRAARCSRRRGGSRRAPRPPPAPRGSFPGGDRDGAFGNAHAEDLAARGRLADAIPRDRGDRVGIVAVDLLEVHDEAQDLPASRVRVAVHQRDVQHAEAAHLEEVAKELGAAALERVRGDAGELGGVVGDEDVAADSRDRARARSCPTLASPVIRTPVPVHVHHDAVDDAPLGELLLQEVAKAHLQLVEAQARDEHGDVGVVGQRDDRDGRREVVADDEQVAGRGQGRNSKARRGRAPVRRRTVAPRSARAAGCDWGC